ncbi:MAG: 50S ribosomal protein L4 [Pseudomonadota bacterium]
MTVTAKIYDQTGASVGEVELPEHVFGMRPHPEAMFEAVMRQQAAHRRGTASTKTRSAVRGGGIKPFKQKGTGNARQGSSRSPLLVGGGSVFGPRPRNYDYRLPRKIRELALRSALSQVQKEGKLYIIREFQLKEPKTETVLTLMAQWKIARALVVDIKNENLNRSVRNLPGSKYLEAAGLNVRDLLKYGNVVVTSAALSQIQERFTS